MYRIVFDPSVILRGLINPRSICARLLSKHAGHYKAVFSAQTSQLLVVLLYHPILIAKYPNLAHIDPRLVGVLMTTFAEKVTIDPAPGRHIVAATAIAATADYIITDDPSTTVACYNIGIPLLTPLEFATLLAVDHPVEPD